MLFELYRPGLNPLADVSTLNITFLKSQFDRGMIVVRQALPNFKGTWMIKINLDFLIYRT